MIKKLSLYFKKCFSPTVYVKVPDEEHVSIITGEILDETEELKRLEQEVDLNSTDVNESI